MFGVRLATAAYAARRTLMSVPKFHISHIETTSTYLRINPLQNNLVLQNMREIIQSRRDLMESELCEVVALNDLLNMILRGTLSVKSIDSQ